MRILRELGFSEVILLLLPVLAAEGGNKDGKPEISDLRTGKSSSLGRHGDPGHGMTTGGVWSAGGMRPTTGGIWPRRGSAAGRFCAVVICNVIWKVNCGQYACDGDNARLVEKARQAEERSKVRSDLNFSNKNHSQDGSAAFFTSPSLPRSQDLSRRQSW